MPVQISTRYLIETLSRKQQSWISHLWTLCNTADSTCDVTLTVCRRKTTSSFMIVTCWRCVCLFVCLSRFSLEHPSGVSGDRFQYRGLHVSQARPSTCGRHSHWPWEEENKHIYIPSVFLSLCAAYTDKTWGNSILTEKHMKTHHWSLHCIRSGAGRMTRSSFKNYEDKDIHLNFGCL